MVLKVSVAYILLSQLCVWVLWEGSTHDRQCDDIYTCEGRNPATVCGLTRDRFITAAYHEPDDDDDDRFANVEGSLWLNGFAYLQWIYSAILKLQNGWKRKRFRQVTSKNGVK
jgi:hypothetical protein